MACTVSAAARTLVVLVRSFGSELTALLAIMPLQKLSRRNDRVTVGTQAAMQGFMQALREQPGPGSAAAGVDKLDQHVRRAQPGGPGRYHAAS